MNQAILDFFQNNLTAREFAGKSVIELGSYNVNGSVRPDIMLKNPAFYVGVDIQEGPCVDIVCNIQDISIKFEPESFDIVISTEMLQHVIDFVNVINNIKKLTKVGGLVLLSTRSKGFGYHSYPYDFWRYEIEDIKELFADFEIINLISDGSNGIIFKGRKIAHEILDISTYPLYNIVYDKKLRSDTTLCKKFINDTFVNKGNNFFRKYHILSDLGKNTGTDKYQHGYLQKYEYFLRPFKNDKFNLLELGIWNGASLAMWEQYFPNAHIFGCDVNPLTYKYTSERTTVKVLDLGKLDSYQMLMDRKYLIIVDDASHFQDHQILSFLTLFPYVESGGIYILEDLHTSFPPLAAKYMHGSNEYAANLLLDLAQLVVSQNHPWPDKLNAYHDMLKVIAPTVDCISFIGKSCIIIKK